MWFSSGYSAIDFTDPDVLTNERSGVKATQRVVDINPCDA
jgi:hypothetical protein